MAMVSHPQGSFDDGVYSNVCLSAETQDQGGIELQIRTVGRQPSVTLKTCQGGCWEQPTSEVVVRKDRITFLATDQAFDEKGNLVAATIHRFTGRFRAGALVVESPGYYPPQRLTKQRWPAVAPSASGPSDWPTPIRRCG